MCAPSSQYPIVAPLLLGPRTHVTAFHRAVSPRLSHGPMTVFVWPSPRPTYYELIPFPFASPHNPQLVCVEGDCTFDAASPYQSFFRAISSLWSQIVWISGYLVQGMTQTSQKNGRDLCSLYVCVGWDAGTLSYALKRV